MQFCRLRHIKCRKLIRRHSARLVWKCWKHRESTAINWNEFEKWLPNKCVYLFASIRFKSIQAFVVQTCECKLIKCIYCRHSTAGNYFMIKGTCVRVKCILSWTNSYHVVHEAVSITMQHIFLVLRRRLIWGFQMQQSIFMNNAVGSCDGQLMWTCYCNFECSNSNFKKYRINYLHLVAKGKCWLVSDLIQI